MKPFHTPPEPSQQRQTPERTHGRSAAQTQLPAARETRQPRSQVAEGPSTASLGCWSVGSSSTSLTAVGHQSTEPVEHAPQEIEHALNLPGLLAAEAQAAARLLAGVVSATDPDPARGGVQPVCAWPWLLLLARSRSGPSRWGRPAFASPRVRRQGAECLRPSAPRRRRAAVRRVGEGTSGPRCGSRRSTRSICCWGASRSAPPDGRGPRDTRHGG
jgi:hypothetical protein